MNLPFLVGVLAGVVATQTFRIAAARSAISALQAENRKLERKVSDRNSLIERMERSG